MRIYSSSKYPFLTEKQSSTEHFLPVTELDINSLLSSRIVLPNKAKCKASMIADLPTPFFESSLSLLRPVITLIPVVRLILTGISPMERKLTARMLLNCTKYTPYYIREHIKIQDLKL